ncbi:Phage antirepressor protein KilAC domain protein [compost metagenome]
MSRLDEDEKGLHSVKGIRGDGVANVINESGLYSLILTSRKESAKRFKKWVTGEVLPSIRKTGSFGVAAPDLTNAAALRGLLLGYTEQVLQLEAKVAEDAPKVEFYDNVAVATGTQTVQEVAKEFGIGANKFYKLLRDQKILMDHPNRNVPYQKFINSGHFRVERVDFIRYVM